MIYYFSGTGNSQWAAERLAQLTEDKAQSMAQLEEVSYGVRLGIVFPIHAWGVPQLVEQFMKRLRVPQGTFVYVVATCGENVGHGLDKLDRFLKVDSVYSVIMPNNYLIGAKVDAEETVQNKVLKASEALQQISEEVLARKAVTRLSRGKLVSLIDRPVHKLYKKYGRETKYFFVQDSCTSCRLCVTLCPVKKIEMEGDKPRWKAGSCEMCLACLHHCPVSAIQYTRNTIGKERYVFKEI